MKKIIVVLAMISVVILTSCSKKVKTCTVTEKDGVKIYKNKNIPSNPDFKLNLNKILEIKGNNSSDSLGKFFDPQYLATDTESNLYILDSYSCSVKKYDPKGDFVLSFGRKGQGPGEFTWPFYLNNILDTLIVTDIGRGETSKFTMDGKYLYSSFNKENFFLRYANLIGNTKMIGFKKTNVQENGNWYSDHDLILTDKKLNVLKSFRRAKFKFDNSDYKINDFYNSYAISKDRIYVARDGSKKYEIDVYDFNGKKISEIHKQYRELKFTKKELDIFQEQEDLMNKRYKIELYVVKPINKRTINAMYVDKHDRLWVVPSVERNDKNFEDYYVDIFDKGVFVNRIKLDNFLKGKDYFNDQKVFFINDKIYSVDNLNTKIDVYDY